MFQIFSTFLCKTIFEIPQNGNTTSKRYFSFFNKLRETDQPVTSPYIILRATKDDYKPIVDQMHESFYPDEPTAIALGLCNTNSNVLDEYTLKHLAEGISLVAKCKYDGCIAGACINMSNHPWDPALKEKLACNVKCTKVKKLLLFYAYAERMPDLWKCYDVQKIFTVDSIFTVREHRRKGIAKRLLQESRSLAADCGFRVVRLDATSVFSATLCENEGMKLVATIPYCTYIGRNMEPVFCPPHPHTSYKIFIDDHPQMTLKRRKDSDRGPP